jgi:hypothetical protein
MSCAGDNYVVPGADPCAGGVNSITAGAGISITGTPSAPTVTNTGIQSLIAGEGISITSRPANSTINSNPAICQFYKLSNQNQTSPGPTIIWFNAEQTWRDINSESYIWYQLGSTTRFQVIRSGVYQLEFALLVNGAGASWNTQRQAQIFVIRGGSSALLQQSVFVPSGNGYGAQVTGTLKFEIGDFIECHLVGNNTSGLTQIQGFDGGFDYNTTFTWTYIRP